MKDSMKESGINYQTRSRLYKNWKLLDKSTDVLTGKILTTFYRRMILFVYPLTGAIPVLRPRIEVDITILKERDLESYLRFRPDQSIEEIQTRLEIGHRCFVCWYEDRIVDAGWVATGRVNVPYLRRRLVLNPKDIYNYDAYTLAPYRGLGLYMARNSYVAIYSQKEGYTRSVAMVAVENKAPKLILQRSGLKPIGLYNCLRFGPWQLEWKQQWAGEALLGLSKS
jgi:hypothetical protein